MRNLKPFLFIVLIFTSCEYQESNNQPTKTESFSEKITIATAANMQFAMKELSSVFTEKTGIKCNLVISSSGKLTAQIKEGAPYDVFVAANMKYPLEIYNSKLAENKPKVYAYGKLVLWSVIDGAVPSLEILNNISVNHIALANPKTAPYGKAATEALNSYHLYPLLENKLVFGESVSQTNQFILSKSVEIGFTSMSTVLSPNMKNKGQWVDIPSSTYTPIEQGVIVIKHNNQAKLAAKEFYTFLFSNEAKKILTNFGYSVNE